MKARRPIKTIMFQKNRDKIQQHEKRLKLKLILGNQININWKNRIRKINRFEKIQGKIKNLKNGKIQKIFIFIILKKQQNIFISLVNLRGEVVLKTTLKKETKGKYEKRWERRKPDALAYCLNSFLKKALKLNVHKLLAMFIGTNKFGLNAKIKWLVKKKFNNIPIIKIFQPKGWDTMREKKIKRV